MSSNTSRRERAIKRLTGRTDAQVTPYDHALFDAYEAELAADLEKPETLERAFEAYWGELHDEQGIEAALRTLMEAR